jgi:hypothetical protein
MEYIVIKRTKLYKSNDMLSIEKTAKTLDEAIKFKVALEMLDSGESKSYHVMIDTHDAFALIIIDRTTRRKQR